MSEYPKMKRKKAEVRYGSFFTDEERAELEQRQEPPLITVHGDEMIVAYDAADTVFRFKLRRVEEGTLIRKPNKEVGDKYPWF